MPDRDADAPSYTLTVEITDATLVEWLGELPPEHLDARVEARLVRSISSVVQKV